MFPILFQKFPHEIGQPKFVIGDRVRFISQPAEDYGIVVGLQFAPAVHLPGWAWRYTIRLDFQSPNRAWTDSDLAWEADLQLLTTAPVNLLCKEQSA
ncbi:hypothetical protein JOY44_21145 [Phormidium sp. CLA17]|uniref:hypothetical protein n=1 Tax=Leptolyngbya sp. Cla-17 TaxID=2803751 RepID=UPI001490A076|nr:hypothetical protein [Leptolyngbya sp. Cla-17]MBM0744094.1 hypothetical protein [Leptolyngbya sp. Cla-17]